jgi:hypothetical protein
VPNVGKQFTFAGGEIAPSLYARTDAVKYATGARTMRNFVIHRHGGASNRAGLHYLGSVKDPALTGRLVPWVFNDDQTYVLEFGDRALRFWRARGRVTAGSGSTPPAAWSDGTAYAAGALLTALGTVYPYYYARAAHTATAATQPEVGAEWQTVWYPLSDTTYEIPTPYLASELPTLQYVQSADVMTLAHPAHPVRELLRYDHDRWVLRDVDFGPKVGTPPALTIAGGIAGDDTHYGPCRPRTSPSSSPGTRSRTRTSTRSTARPTARPGATSRRPAGSRSHRATRCGPTPPSQSR